MTIPSNPSNRTLITIMEAWGWTRHNRSGKLEMRWPATKERVVVEQATSHAVTRRAIVSTIIKITCKGDAEKFWNGPKTVSPDPVLAEPVGQKPINLEPFGLTAVAAPPEFGKKARHANRGVSRLILDELVKANNKPMTAAQAGELVGVEMTVAASSLAYLCERGHAVRVLAGQYVAHPSRLPSATVRHEVTGGTQDHRTTEHTAPAPVAPPTPDPERSAVAAWIDPEVTAVIMGEESAPAPKPPTSDYGMGKCQPDPDFVVQTEIGLLPATDPALQPPFDLGKNLDELAESLKITDWAAEVDEVMQLWLPEKVRLADMTRISAMRQQMIEFAEWVNRP